MGKMSKKQATEAKASAKKLFDYLRARDRHYGHPSHDASTALQKTAQSLDLPTHGVEGWSVAKGGCVLYLNTGDLYDFTVVARCGKDKVRFSMECPADILLGGGKWAPES